MPIPERSYRRLIPRAGDGAVDDVVHGALGDPIVEQVAEQLDHAAGRAMADQHQGQDQLPQPRLGDREVEEDLVGPGRGGERPVEGDLGGGDLLIDELPADLMLASQLGDRLGPGEGPDGQLLPLLRQESLGRAGDGGRCGDGLGLRERDAGRTLAVHACFLHVGCGIENPAPTWGKQVF